jgi:uncharacterized protein YkwD
VGAFFLLLSASIALAPPADTTDPIDAPRAAITARINRERVDRGHSPVELDAALNSVAQARAEELAAVEELAEAEDTAEHIALRVAAAGYEHDLVLETVLAGGDRAEERVEGWIESRSPTSLDALSGPYRDLGLGLSERDDDSVVCVLIFGLSARDVFETKTSPLADRHRMRQEMIARVNAERAGLRLPPLKENALLDQVAQSHAEDMLRRSYYGHETPEGASALDRVRRTPYRAASVGENIAQGHGSVEEVVDAWLASPVHREHILSRAFLEIGLGLAFGRNNEGYQILWVQVFGAPGTPRRLRR